VDAANVVSFALCLELMVVYEILCPFWHSEVLASFVQFDDPACAYAEPVITNLPIYHYYYTSLYHRSWLFLCWFLCVFFSIVPFLLEHEANYYSLNPSHGGHSIAPNTIHL